LRLDGLALIVACSAAMVSLLVWFENRRPSHASFGAAVTFDIDTLAAKHHFGIGLHNFGPGVAHIQSVTYYLDRAPIEDISDALERLGFDPDHDTGVDLDHGDLAPADDVIWLIDYSPRDRTEEAKVREIMEHRIATAVEYCDANDACVRICSQASGCPAQTSGADAAPKSQI
jgi:hypothetical protein